MSLVTTPNFASIAASGEDWRDISRKVLEALAPLRQRAEPFNLGFLYVTDHLVDDLQSFLDLLRSVTGVEHWVGSAGLGVCSSGADYVDIPAASIMLARFSDDAFRVFPVTDLTLSGARDILEPWLDTQDAMLALVHGDPMADGDPSLILAELERLTGGFIAGGLTSSRGAHLQIAGQVAQGGVGGVVFSSDIDVASTLTQGCAPLGPMHIITRSDQQVIMELDGRPAFEVFTDDLKIRASIASGEDYSGHDITQALFRDEFDSLDETVKNLFRGEVHVAFPVTGSDQSDYMVRNLVGIDPDTGWVAVSHHVEPGDPMMFVHRDDATVRVDLIRALTELRDRIIREQGKFAPQGAIYVSCVARAMADLGVFGGEMKIVQDVLGDIPLTGFYANGEISNRRLYGYTGILILFL